MSVKTLFLPLFKCSTRSPKVQTQNMKDELRSSTYRNTIPGSAEYTNDTVQQLVSQTE